MNKEYKAATIMGQNYQRIAFEEHLFYFFFLVPNGFVNQLIFY